MDQDGDLVVLAVAQYDNTIAWYENTDGQATFGPRRVISSQATAVFSAYAADLDGDRDLDVLFASPRDNKIAWYENRDGRGAFGAQRVMTTQAAQAAAVFACDLDGDGDLDALSASFGDNKIAWYQNTDGQGSFSGQRVITTQALGAADVSAADLDGDGDPDVLSASYSDNKIAWYENTDGRGTFGQQQIITSRDGGARSVAAVDSDELPTGDLLRRYDERWKLIVVGDAAMHPAELVEPHGCIDPRRGSETPSVTWLHRLHAHFDRSAWLNPDDEKIWNHSYTARIVRRLFAMYPLSVEGVADAAAALVGGRVASTVG